MPARSNGSASAPSITDGPEPIAVSVAVAVRDGEKTLATLLASLARQTYCGPWEVIVADNGSRDRSREVAFAFADRLPNLRVIDASAVRGVAHARNVAIRAARASRVVFADADDEVADDWLEHIAAALDRHPAVASRFDKTRLNPPEVAATRELAQERGLSRHDYAPFLPHAGTSGFGVRVEVHDAIGGFDEHFLRLSDTDYSWRLQLAGFELHYEPKAVLYVRFRDTPTEALRQAFRYGRYNGHLYQRYRRHGMPRVPLAGDLKRLAILLAKAPFGTDAVKRQKRWRTIANLAGIVLGRLEARLLRR